VQNLTFGAIAGYDLTNDLAGLKKRVLMLWGVDDPIGLDIAEEIKAALPAAEVRLIRIEGCGHFWQEKPEEFMKGIREFLSISSENGRAVGGHLAPDLS